MKFQVNETLSRLKEQYNKSLKNNTNLYISRYSDAEGSVLDPSDAFIGLNENDIGKFLNRSTPVLLHPDDLIKIKSGNEEAEIPTSVLINLKNKDFTDLAYPDYANNKNYIIEVSRSDSINVKLIEKNLEKLATQYCKKANEQVEKTLKGKIKENVIYHINCPRYESSAVFDGETCVASGNYWDFHPGCAGLSAYKKIKLGDWHGAGSLAQMLSIGLKKTIIKLQVNVEDYELLAHNSYVVKEKEQEKKNKKEMISLFARIALEERAKEELKEQELKKRVLSSTEMIEVLKKRYGGDFYEGDKDDHGGIRFDSSRFYSYERGINKKFEDFVMSYKGWYVEILDAESIALLPC